jgi:hypothetical protein
MYTYVYIYMYIYIYICIYVYVYICIYIYIYIYIYTFLSCASKEEGGSVLRGHRHIHIDCSNEYVCTLVIMVGNTYYVNFDCICECILIYVYLYTHIYAFFSCASKEGGGSVLRGHRRIHIDHSGLCYLHLLMVVISNAIRRYVMMCIYMYMLVHMFEGMYVMCV